jgi:hypothetical protein
MTGRARTHALLVMLEMAHVPGALPLLALLLTRMAERNPIHDQAPALLVIGL